MASLKFPLVLVAVMCFIINVASEKHVVCYYGTWATYRPGLGKFDVAHIKPELCTHLMYTFAGINNQGNVISLDPYLDLPDNWGRNNFGAFNALKQQNPSLKTLLAVGGWNEGSAKYSAMAANPALRNNFITSVVKMLQDHGFDGLDLDWEYPNRRDTVHGVADIENYTQLLKELREEFDKHGYLLSAAVSSVREMASQSYDIPAISRYLDLINVMTYDMYGSWDPVTGHNSPLHAGIGDSSANVEDLYTVDMAVQYWLDEGAPPEKLVIGVPFYGRTFTLSNPDNNSVRAPSSGPGIAGAYTATNGFIGYNEMAANPALRNNFITSVVKMLQDHGFDGLDLDWEYPNRRDTVHGVADIENYTQLLKELREEFDKHGYLLSAAVSSVREMASQSYDIPAISRYLDLINVMTYDMYGSWDPVTGHNSPLHAGIGDSSANVEDLYTVDMAVQYWLDEGAPPEKLVIGVPFYGRTFTLSNPDNNSVRAPSSGPGIAGAYTATNGFIGYNEFCVSLQTQSWNVRYDDLAKVPYAYSGRNWVSYDDAASIVEKVNFAISKNIGGIMIWSIETDDFHSLCNDEDFPLLRAINLAFEEASNVPSTIPAVSSTIEAS